MNNKNLRRKSAKASRGPAKKRRRNNDDVDENQEEHVNNDVAENRMEPAPEPQPSEPRQSTSQFDPFLPPSPESSPAPTPDPSEPTLFEFMQRCEAEGLLDTDSDSDFDDGDGTENNAQDMLLEWGRITETGLKDTVKNDILKRFKIPKHLKFLKPPILNPVVAATLTEDQRNYDNDAVERHSLMAHAVAGLTSVFNGLVTRSMKRSEIFNIVSDAGKLISYVQHMYLLDMGLEKPSVETTRPLGDKSNVN